MSIARNPRDNVNAGSMRYESSPLTPFRARAHKIPSCHRRQLAVASPVVNQQNAGMLTIETAAILNQFTIGDISTASVDEMLEPNTGEIRQQGTNSMLNKVTRLESNWGITEDHSRASTNKFARLETFQAPVCYPLYPVPNPEKPWVIRTRSRAQRAQSVVMCGTIAMCSSGAMQAPSLLLIAAISVDNNCVESLYSFTPMARVFIL
jgi:hypothetical protein